MFWLDASRTLALIAMIGFHFFRDLEFFGVIVPGTTSQGSWAIAARMIAGSFIFLSGISLVIAHDAGFRPRPWAKRFAMISGAAALVSLATYLAIPDRFVYFGILHCLAASSLIGAGLLFAPTWLLLALAFLIFGMDGPIGPVPSGSFWLAWTGLSSSVRPSLDFLPLIPWLGVFLAGMACARLIPVSRWDLPFRTTAPARWFSWPGRHSLAVYLVHQPVLISFIALAVWLGR
ncbi:heparan-alpha-glucosaminide N-acetyltransferase [Marimonas sp. MJW-29]|uniref:Heparan-alpha-glucosaminide N-acetyltransferase n=1 Tax=Sulfitobacter sediminis TaxID=3234186 RepID=A0ABV3RKM0_9RHOB